MTARELLRHLGARGVVIEVVGDKLRVNAARGVLDEALKASIAAHQRELMDLVSSSAGRAASTEPIRAAEPGGDSPLSFFQERLWMLQELDPASTAFSLAAWWHAPPVDDVESLVSALETVTSRHRVLRSTFVDGAARAPVETQSVPRLAIVDWRGAPPHEQKRRLYEEFAAAAHRRYVLATEPPASFTVLRITDRQAVVLLAAHHIAIDAWSISLLHREVAALCAGESLAPVLQYRDFAVWQRRTTGGDALERDLTWWAQTLAGAPPSSTFESDRTQTMAPAVAVADFAWDEALSAGVRALAAEAGATVFMAMVAACAVVLRAHTRQDDVVVGNPTGVRERPELEAVVGPFVNVQPLRLRMDDDPSFGVLLRRTRDVCLDAHEHRDVPLELLLERLRPARTADHAPLFQVAVVQHNAMTHEDLHLAGGGAMHELTLFFREAEGRLVGALEYRADLFSAEAIDRIASQLETLLRSAVAEPSRSISALSIVSPAARRQLLQKCSDAVHPLDPAPFVRQFAREVARHPDRIAVGYAGQHLSYADLNERANTLARGLRQGGVGPGVFVGVCLDRSLELVVALIAVHKAGGAYLPLDPAFPAERLNFMLQDSGAGILIASKDAAAELRLPDTVRVIDPTSLPATARPDHEDTEPVAGSGDPAYLIYTSGSTGRPKGVVIPHGALSNFLGAMRREPGLGESDVLAAVTTVSFDIAALELFLPLTVGARIELVARDTASDDVALIEQLAVSGATVLQATPATWRMLVDANWQPVRPVRALCGGETLPRDLADSLLERVQELVNLYGPTETTVWSTLERVRPSPNPITIGTPIANTRVYVVNSHGDLAPIGVAGEIWIGGAGVALGYHARPEFTAERFMPDPFADEPDARLFRTGDAGMWDGEGRLRHLGRLDNQLKIRGFRIEPGEIEAALQAHPAVKQAVVLGRSAAPSDVRLVAYLVFHSGDTLTTSEVRSHLRASLPHYMIPSVVVTVEAIPVTPSGKVDRAALPDPFKRAVQPGDRADTPMTAAEEAMADVWRDVLKVERVGAEDNFFELGGHSLLALRVTIAVQARLGRRMDPRLLFFRNLRQITRAVVEADAERTS